MRRIVYHVAMTLDNFIAHEDGSIGGFAPFAEGEHVNEYLASLQSYDTVLLGRATYEFGYQYGLKPGQPAYPHMKHYIFSKTLRFASQPDPRVEVISEEAAGFVRKLKEGEGTDIYLCGGGNFASYLFENELIDELKLKLYPILLGRGIRLFGESTKALNLALLQAKTYHNGALLLTYKLQG